MNQDLLKQLEAFCLMDDIFFFKCFKDHPEAVAFILQIILMEPDLHISRLRMQEDIRQFFYHSARLDCAAVVNGDRIIDLEIQQADAGANIRRARAYASSINVEEQEKGIDYQKMSNTIVIFITKNDVLNKGLPIYHIGRAIKETKEGVEDGEEIIYVNCSYIDDTPLGRLKHDLLCTDPDKMYYSILADRVRQVKRTKKGASTMCEILKTLQKESIEKGIMIGEKRGVSIGEKRGIEKGISIGEEKGSLHEKIKMTKKLLDDGSLSVEKISDLTGLSIEEIHSLK